MKKMFFISALTGLAIMATAQTAVPILEKSYEISKQAKKGYLAYSEINKDGNIEMVYLLGGLKAAFDPKCETYIYNKDLELINTEKEGTVKKTHGPDYVKYTVGVEATFKGISFVRREVSTKWSNHDQVFFVTQKTLEKIQPKTETGAKYSLTYSYQMMQEGATLCLAGKPLEKKQIVPKVNTYYGQRHFDILRCDLDGNIIVTDSINLDFANDAYYHSPLSDSNSPAFTADENVRSIGKDSKDEVVNNEAARDWILVFKPMYLPDYFKAERDPNQDNLTYVRISPKGKVLEKFTFTPPSNGWTIANAYEHNGSVYMYGVAKTYDSSKKPSSMSFSTGAEAKYTNLELCKITNGKMDFSTSVSAKDIQAKQAKPSNQKKFVEWDGESVMIQPAYFSSGLIANMDITPWDVHKISFTSSGDIMINAQDAGGKGWNSNYMFLFDANTGALKKSYGLFLATGEKKRQEVEQYYGLPIRNYYFPSGDGKSTYWIMISFKPITSKLGGFVADYCSINNETGEISELKTMAIEKKKHYVLYSLSNDFLKKDNFLFFFNQEEEADKAMLSRIDLSK